MKTLIKITTLTLFAAGLSAGTLFAHGDGGHAGGGDASTTNQAKAKPADPQTPAPSTSKADYPLDTCVVSGDKLEGNDMGAPIDYIYKQEGKPDRLVRLCCKGCVKDFNKDPAKYLKMIDDAAAAKAKGTGDHSGHNH